jgi:TolA-binding protein
MQNENIVEFMSKNVVSADILSSPMQNIVIQLDKIEAHIEDHSSITRAQGRELIEIRKDQEHLYKTMQSLRNEVALLFAKIETLYIFSDN